jgi:hypothetical protein
MTGFSDVPFELIIHLASFVDRTAILSFALASRICFEAANREALPLHQAYHRRFSRLDESGAESLRAKVKDVFDDEMAAWHVRRIRIEDVYKMFDFWISAEDRNGQPRVAFAWLDTFARRILGPDPDMLKLVDEFWDGDNSSHAFVMLLVACPGLRSMVSAYEPDDWGTI